MNSHSLYLVMPMFLFLISCSSNTLTTSAVKATSANAPTPLNYSSSRVIGPLLETQWGQSGVWQQSTPLKDENPTYPGCTTVATAQILYYYQYQNYANTDTCYRLDHELESPDIEGKTLCIDFQSSNITYNWDELAKTAQESSSKIESTADFLYHVGVTLNAQFGGGEGASGAGESLYSLSFATGGDGRLLQ